MSGSKLKSKRFSYEVMHEDLATLFCSRLERNKINYMVTGSVASMLYGIPRYTNDIDLVIHLIRQDISKLLNAFPHEAFYSPPSDVVLMEISRPLRGHFNIIHHESGYRADIYLLGADPLHQWGMANRKRINLTDNEHLWLAPPEYVIVRKLEYYREGQSDKHIADIQNMLEISRSNIDLETLKRFIVKLKLEEEWSKIQIIS